MAPIDQKKFLEKWKRGLELGAKALSLYKTYGFRERPFRRDLINENSYLFVPPKAFYEFSEWVAACYSASLNGLLIAPTDIGKTTLTRFFLQTLTNSKESQAVVNAHYIQLKGLADASEKNPKPEEVFMDGPNAIGLEAELHNRHLIEAGILLIDDIDIGLRRENYVDELSRYFHSADQAVIGLTTPSITPEIMELFDDTYKITSLEDNIIVKMLKTRILYYKEKDSSGLAPFTEIALHKIAEYSMGLPGLALDLADSCLREIDELDVEEITAEVVNHVAQVLQYTLAKEIAMGNVIKYIENDEGKKKQKEVEIDITTSKGRILREILFHGRKYPEMPGITNTKLSKSTRIPIQAHTISYHTGVLETCKILEVTKGRHAKRKGKHKYFQLKKPVMNAIELKILSSKPKTAETLKGTQTHL